VEDKVERKQAKVIQEAEKGRVIEDLAVFASFAELLAVNLR